MRAARRHAWALVRQRDHTEMSAAQTMGLSEQRVRELMTAEDDRRELASLRCDSIPVALTQAVITQALARDPDLTIAEIADWLDMPRTDFERAFLAKSDRGRPKRRVTVASASRLMIALGRAPNELPRC